MHVEFAFFEGDDLLVRGCCRCQRASETMRFNGEGAHEFILTHRLELPASPIEIECHRNGVRRYSAALRMGVHDSDDWESVDLGGIHTLGFLCTVQRAAG